jgi:catechol 2,3-dioxygenase-like lactoylglutathione lyase family enzyme
MDIRQLRVSVRAKSFDRTCRFYGESLALPILGTWERDDLRGALYQLGPGVLEVVGRAPGAARAARDEIFDYQGPDHKLTLSLAVASAEQAYQDLLLRDKNIPGGLLRDAAGMLVFETRDPDGVTLLFREEG